MPTVDGQAMPSKTLFTDYRLSCLPTWGSDWRFGAPREDRGRTVLFEMGDDFHWSDSGNGCEGGEDAVAAHASGCVVPIRHDTKQCR